MTGIDPTPSSDASEVRQWWHDETDTFGRVYDVVLGITDPTPYPDIAELASCSQNAAKKHLDRLEEMGIVRADWGTRPARYARNDGYLEWQEATRIANELSIDEIIERVERLEEHRNTFEETFDTSDPSEINVFEHDDHEMIHERMEAVSEWQSIERDIRLYEIARRIARNNGHLIPV
jgi:DNA-binding transcriptional regulator GbsR (MarR family)